MKTKEELNELKEEIEKLDEKLHELTEEELAQVTGGVTVQVKSGAISPLQDKVAVAGIAQALAKKEDMLVQIRLK